MASTFVQTRPWAGASARPTRVASAAQLVALSILGLALVAAIAGVLPAMALALLGTGSAVVTTSVPTRRSIIVVGDSEFLARARMAAGGRRRIVSEWDPTSGLRPVVNPADEVIVDGRYLDAFRQHASDLLAGDRVVRVAPGGQVDSALFTDVLDAGQRSVKRVLDLTLSLVMLLVSSPLLLIAVVAVKLDSSGPAFFKQERLGAGGRRFRLYKLRTMYTNNDDSAHREYVAAVIRGEADQTDGMFKLVHDPRITRVGRFLRRTSLDEIPQLWNVVRGEMSLVGPRPPLMNEVELYDDQAWQRLRAKPGLTGLWQVSGRTELTFEEMVALDVRYTKEWSPLLEVSILLRTPRVVLSARGAA